MVNKMKTAFAAVGIAMLFTCAHFARAQEWTDSADPSADVKTPPPPPDLAGTWTGTVDDKDVGETTMDFNFTQVKSVIGGTWEIPGHSLMGTVVDGSVNGKKGSVKFKLKVSGGPCEPKATAELSADDTTMSGKYSEKTKLCHFSGTFSVSLVP